jgi:hypothetical protein
MEVQAEDWLMEGIRPLILNNAVVLGIQGLFGTIGAIL